MDQLAVRPIKLKKGHDGEWTEMKMRWNLKQKGNVKPIKLNSKHMIVINGNDYNNAYDESNDNKKKIKKWITKKIKVLLICVVIKTIIIEIIKILITTIMIIIVIIIINNSHL